MSGALTGKLVPSKLYHSACGWAQASGLSCLRLSLHPCEMGMIVLILQGFWETREAGSKAELGAWHIADTLPLVSQRPRW